MTSELSRGRLADPDAAPLTGELVERVLARGGVVIEHILSGTLDEPVAYRQDDDEWVVLLAGSARLSLGGDRLELTAGDWVFIPAGLEHELEETAQGSRWLAVFLAPR